MILIGKLLMPYICFSCKIIINFVILINCIFKSKDCTWLRIIKLLSKFLVSLKKGKVKIISFVKSQPY